MKFSTTDERKVVVLCLVIFALPAGVAAANTKIAVPDLLLKMLWMLVVVAVGSYWLLTRQEGRGARTGEKKEADDVLNEPDPDGETELVLMNYEMLSQQAMYRDKLLINANYFSLAVVGLLMNIAISVNMDLRPSIAMVGATTAYAFWLATESYKGTRDSLNKHINKMEEVHDELSATNAYDLRERTPVSKRSLSSYLTGIQIVATIFWTALYIATMFQIGYS